MEAPLMGFRDYLRVVARRRWVVVAGPCAGLLIALIVVVVQTPTYEATASVLLQPNAASSLSALPGAATNGATPDASSEAQVVTSQPVTNAVRTMIGEAPPVTVTGTTSTNEIDILSKSDDARRAAAIADAYANAYVAYRRTQAAELSAAAGSALQAKIAALRNQIHGLQLQIQSAEARNQAGVATSLGAQVDSLVTQQGTYQQQLGQLQLQAKLASAGVQLVRAAAVPGSAVSPRPARDLLLGFLAGLIVGLGTAFGLEYFDTSVKSAAELERMAPGVPNLALVPHVPERQSSAGAKITTLHEPHSGAAEAYRTLATSIRFVASESRLRTLVMTSPSPGDGKTTILANLSVALAEVGLRVVVVDCDLRRPRLHDRFGVSNSVGFTSILQEAIPPGTALQPAAGIANLSILPAGPLGANPPAMLSSVRAKQALEALGDQADIVLVDTPPVVPVTDAAILSEITDGTLLVVRLGWTTRKQFADAYETLFHVKARLLGTVLGGVTETETYPYAHSAEEPASDARRRWSSRLTLPGPKRGDTRPGTARLRRSR